MNPIRILFFLVTTTVGVYISSASFGQSPEKNFFKTHMDYQIQASFSIGGSSPLGLPRSIRKIESFNPGLQLGLEANATKWLTDSPQWGIRLGMAVEGKGMKTSASVKNYLTEIIRDDASVRGYFTGTVRTNVNNTYFTIPVTAVYQISDTWRLLGGLYVSGLLDQQFSGSVNEGYFREGTPVGNKLTFTSGGAAYDFSKELKNFLWGAKLGGEAKIGPHFNLIGNVTYGINGIFKKDFHSIAFDMHNIYANLGFGYLF